MATVKPKDVNLDEVLFEFHSTGRVVRVAAIDTRTNTEVSIVGDPAYGEVYLKKLALNKLRYVLAKSAPGKGGGKRDPWEGL